MLVGLAVGGAPAAGAMSLSAPAIDDGARVPVTFTCDGAGKSPALMIQSVPKAARSLVLIIDDPDAPGGVFTHWGLYNLSPDVSFLAAGAASHSLPGPAASVANGYQQTGYGPICPPHGARHRYRFKLWALDTRISETPRSPAALARAVKGHVVARSRFTAVYSRS